MARNLEAGQVYMMCRAQYVTAEQGGVVDISIPAIKIAMDAFGVTNQLDCLMQVRRVWHEVRSRREAAGKYDESGKLAGT